MRYKFSLITKHTKANKLIQCVQNSIMELAIAFGSSITIKETPFEDIENNFKEQDSALLLIGNKEDLKEVSDRLGLFAQIQHYSGVANISLLKSERLAKGSVLYPISSSQADFASFTGLVQAQKNNSQKIISADNIKPILEKILFTPEEMGDIVCDYNTGLIIKTLATLISGTQQLQFKILMGNLGKLHFVPLADGAYNDNSISPYGLYFAVSDILNRFKLERESMCLQTANANVLKAGWRTEDCFLSSEEKLTSTEDICSLVDEQIQLAGELMQR
ncbi:MAG: hypothetical protein Q4E07_06320 [Eubacteriales bacterium]|nr:hypothetical protein [Eubacteriales bacterium]